MSSDSKQYNDIIISRITLTYICAQLKASIPNGSSDINKDHRLYLHSTLTVTWCLNLFTEYAKP